MGAKWSTSIEYFVALRCSSDATQKFEQRLEADSGWGNASSTDGLNPNPMYYQDIKVYSAPRQLVFSTRNVAEAVAEAIWGLEKKHGTNSDIAVLNWTSETHSI